MRPTNARPRLPLVLSADRAAEPLPESMLRHTSTKKVLVY
jgi:hypothetical protein